MSEWPAQLRRRDRDVIETMTGIVSIHPYTASWFNNASFVFPLLAALGSLIAWATTGSAELLGVGIFFAVYDSVAIGVGHVGTGCGARIGVAHKYNFIRPIAR